MYLFVPVVATVAVNAAAGASVAAPKSYTNEAAPLLLAERDLSVTYPVEKLNVYFPVITAGVASAITTVLSFTVAVPSNVTVRYR